MGEPLVGPWARIVAFLQGTKSMDTFGGNDEMAGMRDL